MATREEKARAYARKHGITYAEALRRVDRGEHFADDFANNPANPASPAGQAIYGSFSVDSSAPACSPPATSSYDGGSSSTSSGSSDSGGGGGCD